MELLIIGAIVVGVVLVARALLRQPPQHDTAPTQVAPEPSAPSVPWWQNLMMFWPRLAFATGVFVALGVAAWSLMDSMKQGTAESQLARNNRALEEKVASSAEEPESLRDETGLAAKPVELAKEVNAKSRTENLADLTRSSVGGREDEGRLKLAELRERGFDLGAVAPPDADARIEAIYAHARAALYATVDEGAIRDATIRPARVRTSASSRDDYLAHPPAGERLRDDDARAVAALYPERRPQVQFVISDGLNAHAISDQLRRLLPPPRRMLAERGHAVGEAEVVVQNGRVRAGYEIGGLAGAAIVVHVIGERPGTGLNTASAYLTYGLDEAGRTRWDRSLDHSATTAICGIHPKGKPPEAAAEEIARTVQRMVDQRRSGVALQGTP
jgi:ethanolamine ammonia-lyase small subunit